MAAQYLHTLVTNILSLTKLESSFKYNTPYLVEELEEFEEGLIRRHQANHVIIENEG